jgi:hypothetical protein
MKKLLPVVNGLALIATIFISYLSNTGVFGGNTMATISAKYPTLFTPAGWAFSIWGLIYVSLFGFVIFHGRSVWRDREEQEVGGRVGRWFLLSCAANCCWVLAWIYEWTGLSVLIMMVLLISLLRIVLHTKMELTDPPLRTIAFVWWPFCLYVGWITVALIANVAVWLVKIGWNGWGIPEAGWAIIMILVAGGVHLFMTWKRNMREMAFVGVWALAAIAVADKVKAPAVSVVAWVVAGVLCLSSMLHGYRNRAYSPFRKR